MVFDGGETQSLVFLKSTREPKRDCRVRLNGGNDRIDPQGD
jgi:hypothetical protein